ncbi:substrate-binding domain-containing protein [Streptomyces sp. NPDC047046]|uniref:LacI family DNA-binding transcriptional regulator n=1 Tax=Streptomyces sp. NPDC047046 TaxID=3155378 RepID=UPI0033DB8819
MKEREGQEAALGGPPVAAGATADTGTRRGGTAAGVPGAGPPGGGSAAAPSARRPGTSLFQWVKQSLLDSIARGEFDPGEPFITQRGIVERFGVSTTTAVRALNDLVAEGMVVRRRGIGTFVRERPAGRPAAGRTVSYICPEDEGVHHSRLLSGLAAETRDLGYTLSIAHTVDTADEPGVLRQAAESGTSGVVFFPRDRSEASSTVEELRRAGLSVVLVDRYFPDVPTDAVLFDDFAVGHAVTDGVVGRGHEAPVVLWSESDVTTVRDRHNGYLRALRDRGLVSHPDRSALVGYVDLPPGERRARLLSFLDSSLGLTALICGNAVTLALAVDDLLSLDRDLPQTVELASMDDAGPVGLSPLSVVSASLPAASMGREAIRRLHARIQGATDPLDHVVLPAKVTTRSTGRNALGIVRATASAS